MIDNFVNNYDRLDSQMLTVTNPIEMKRLYTRAVVHLEFCCRLYKHQAAQGRYFLHEHLLQAIPWQEDCVQTVMELDGVGRVACDQCQMGSVDRKSGQPVTKPTYFMSNSEFVLRAMGRRCKGKRGECSRPGGRRACCL